MSHVKALAHRGLVRLSRRFWPLQRAAWLRCTYLGCLFQSAGLNLACAVRYPPQLQEQSLASRSKAALL